jgi:DNA polymerase III subunit delta
MVALKSNDVPAFLKSVNKQIECILVFGTDPGQVAETSRVLAHRLAEVSDPAGEILRIEDVDLDNDPDRLIVELRTVQMFGGPKVVRTTASRRINAQSLAPLVEGNLTGRLVVEAGNLKPDDALRALFEKNPKAAAVACYADSGADLERLVAQVLGAAGQTLEADAKLLLIARLGADRSLSRAEIEKLSLYKQGQQTIEVEDVEAIVGDASEQTNDRIIDAVAAGRSGVAVSAFDRAMAAGDNAQVIIGAVQRYFHRLHRVRAALDAGRSFDDAVRTLRPPLFFKQKSAFQSQASGWTSDRLSDARTRIARAALAARRGGDMEEIIAERLLIELCALAAVAKRGKLSVDGGG